MFQERLYELRKRRGISQEELANVVGVSRQAVQKWEAGASRPDMDNLIAIADHFGVSLDYLIRDTDEPGPATSETVHTTVINHYYNEWHYEYKSARTLFGLPLVHVHLGRRNCWARGVFALGNIATGLVSVGGISAGLFSIGGISLGLLALGGLSVGLFAVGAVAIGLLALGAVALGGLALGSVASGIYAAGAVANGSRIAIGEIAAAPLALGYEVEGAAELLLSSPGISRDMIRSAIKNALPNGPHFLVDWLTTLAAHIRSTPIL